MLDGEITLNEKYRLHQIALNQKLSCTFEKLWKISSCVKAKLQKRSRIKWDLPVFVQICLCCIHVYKQRPIKCVCCADLYRHSPTYMTGIFWRVQCKLNFAQVKIEYTYCQLHMYKGTQQKFKTQTHRNLISCSMTSIPPVLLPCSTLPPPPSYGTFIPTKKKMWHTFQYVVINFLNF